MRTDQLDRDILIDNVLMLFKTMAKTGDLLSMLTYIIILFVPFIHVDNPRHKKHMRI